MRFATHELTRNGWSDKNLCYLQSFADQLTLYEKKWCVTHPLICHISAVQVAGEFFVEEIDCLTVVLPLSHPSIPSVVSPRTDVTYQGTWKPRDLLFYLCSPYLAPTIRE